MYARDLFVPVLVCITALSMATLALKVCNKEIPDEICRQRDCKAMIGNVRLPVRHVSGKPVLSWKSCYACRDNIQADFDYEMPVAGKTCGVFDDRETSNRRDVISFIKDYDQMILVKHCISYEAYYSACDPHPSEPSPKAQQAWESAGYSH